MNQTISNPKTEMPKTAEMTDENYLNEILSCAKNMTTNMNLMLNEMSNEPLYQTIFPLYENVRIMQRTLYELAFKKGWYTLEKAEDNKVTKTYNQLETKIQELN